MKLKRYFFFGFAFFTWSMAFAQVDTAWVKIYRETEASASVATAIIVDDSGYVYVTGYSGSSYNWILDYATIKYSPTGDTIWLRRYGELWDQDIARAIALDDSSNVYVTGYSEGSFATVKYSSGGDTLWARKFKDPANYNDGAYAIGVDKSGNVYIAGTIWYDTGQYDYTTVKYSSTGDIVWTKKYNGTGNGNDFASALVVDDSGNVYVTGQSRGESTWTDYATIKYSPSGDTSWVRRYNGTGNSHDFATAMAVDADGYVYVSGYSYGSGTGQDYATIKYAPNGDTLWVRRYSGLSNLADFVSAIKIDTNGNVYVTGQSYAFRGGLVSDFATIKYSSIGDTVWIRRSVAPVSGYDSASAIAVDDSGNVYVTGQSLTLGSYYNYATIKYSPTGDTLWKTRYSGTKPSYSDIPNAIAIDKSGNVYVTGVADYYCVYDRCNSTGYGTIKYVQFACLAKTR